MKPRYSEENTIYLVEVDVDEASQPNSKLLVGNSGGFIPVKLWPHNTIIDQKLERTCLDLT